MTEKELLERVDELEMELIVKDIEIRDLKHTVDWYRKRMYRESFDGDMVLMNKGCVAER